MPVVSETAPEPGDSEAAQAWAALQLTCPGCRVRFAVRARMFVSFPTDAEALLDIVDGKLNLFVCPACGRHGYAGVPVVVARAEPPVVVAFTPPGGLSRALLDTLPPDLRVVSHSTLEELAGTLETWVNGYLMRVQQTLLNPPQNEKRGAVTLRHTPLALLAMRRQLDGADEPGAEPEEGSGGELIFSMLLVEALDKAYTHAFHHGGIVRLHDVAAERVPPGCLTPGVLAMLAERCITPDGAALPDPVVMDRLFRLEYICATAHALAGVRNPRANAWADVCLSLFVLSRQPFAHVAETALLDTRTLRRLIGFPEAWNVGQRLLASTGGRDLYEPWFQHVGQAEMAYAFMLDGAVVMPDYSRTSDDEQLARELFDLLRTSGEGGDSVHVDLVGAYGNSLIARGRPRAAEQFAGLWCEEFAAGEQWKPLGQFLIAGCEALNGARQHGAARKLLAAYASRVMGECADPRIRVGVANEYGNALRYGGRPHDALDVYESALAEPDVLPDERRVLIRNRAIILRDIGRADEAIAGFREVMEQPTADVSRQVDDALSLAAAYAAVNRLDTALEILDGAMEIPLALPHNGTRINLLSVRAELRAVVGDAPELPELSEAWERSEHLPGLRLRACMAVLHCDVRGRVDPAVVAEAVRFATEVRNGGADADAVSRIGLLVRLVDWYQASGDLEQARATAELLRDSSGRLSWDMEWVLAKVSRGAPLAERWPALRRLLEALERSVPESSQDPGITVSWLADKDEMQREIVDAMADAVAAGIENVGVYLDVFEFVSGRDVRRRTDPQAQKQPLESSRGSATDRAAEVLRRSVQDGGAPAALFAFVETSRGLEILVVRDGDPRLCHLPLSGADIRAARQRFERRVGGGCLTARQAAAALDPLAGLLEAVAAAVSDTTSPGDQLCLLPSGNLLGLPLHAAALPGGSLLLERNPVAYAPNLTVLEATLAGGPAPVPGRGPAGLIRVPKQGDRPEFVRRLRDARRDLLRYLGPTAEELEDRAADKGACLRLMARVEHLVILAHGANSTAADGRGICVSDGEQLPQAPLPVDAVPELRRFLLDASDIASVKATPEVFVSMACSSGRTFAGSGGSRVGLERALLTGGTRCMIAPLWDVDQVSALTFLRELYAGWAAGPGTPVGELHRRAVLAVRDRHPHPFHWAPFALKGCWL